MEKYAREVMGEVVLETRTGGNKTAAMSSLAQATHCRFVTLGETSKRQKWSSEAVKRITSGKDKMIAKLYHNDTFEFYPKSKLVLRANELPNAEDVDDAFWERVKIIPFTKSFRGTSEDIEDLDDQIIDAGLEGVLAWCVAGYRDLIANGLQECGTSLSMKDGERGVVDSLGVFLKRGLVACSGSEGMDGDEFEAAYRGFCGVDAFGEEVEGATVAEGGREFNPDWKKELRKRRITPSVVKVVDPVTGKKKSGRRYGFRVK